MRLAKESITRICKHCVETAESLLCRLQQRRGHAVRGNISGNRHRLAAPAAHPIRDAFKLFRPAAVQHDPHPGPRTRQYRRRANAGTRPGNHNRSA